MYRTLQIKLQQAYDRFRQKNISSSNHWQEANLPLCATSKLQYGLPSTIGNSLRSLPGLP
jgi:hypothetical protein